MRELRSFIPSRWRSEVWSRSPVTTLSSESLLEPSSRTTTAPQILLSFNQNSPRSNNCEQDAVLISIINGCTSVYSATVIYSIIGFRATENYDACYAEWVPASDAALRSDAPLRSPCPASLSQQHLNADQYLQLPWRQRHTKQLRRSPPPHQRNRPRCLCAADPKRLRHGEIPQSGEFRRCDESIFFVVQPGWGEAQWLPFVLVQGVEGTGLAFIVFTEAIIKMPVSPLWAVLFFVMLFCLGLSTMFGNIEGVVVPLQDLKVLPRTWPKEVFCGNSLKSITQPARFTPAAEVTTFCLISRSHVSGFLFTGAHFRHALWKLLARSLWQLRRFHPPPDYRLLWDGVCHLHLWRWQVSAGDVARWSRGIVPANCTMHLSCVCPK